MHSVSRFVCYFVILAPFITIIPQWMSFMGGVPESERVLPLKKSFAVRVSRASITVLSLPQKLAYVSTLSAALSPKYSSRVTSLLTIQ